MRLGPRRVALDRRSRDDVPAWPTSEDTPAAPQGAPDNAEEAEDAAMEEAEPAPTPAAAPPVPAAMETEPVIEASGEPF